MAEQLTAANRSFHHYYICAVISDQNQAFLQLHYSEITQDSSILRISTLNQGDYIVFRPVFRPWGPSRPLAQPLCPFMILDRIRQCSGREMPRDKGGCSQKQ